MQSEQLFCWRGLMVPPCSAPGAAGPSLCPPAALASGVGLLCRLFELWGRVPAGVLVLTGWLLGEEEGDGADEAAGLVSIRFCEPAGLRSGSARV